MKPQKEFSKKMEKASDNEYVYDLSSIPPEKLKIAISHNKFGGICFKANLHDKAIHHFNKAIEEMGKVVFTNTYQNLGNVHAQKNQIDEAIKCYELVINTSPHNPENKPKIKDQSIWNPHMNSKEAYIDAYTNLAVMYLKVKQIEKGLLYCQKATELDPDNYTALVNLGDIMRQVGKRNEAIEFTWSLIERYTREKTDLKDYTRPKFLDCSQIKPAFNTNEPINVLCVKWGKKYGADYVNKLYLGLKRHSTRPFKFYCFTDDPSSLHNEVLPIALKESWGGWWGKATLFSREYGITGPKVFIDLDTIITGNVDEILGFDKVFGIMRTDLFECEKENKDGYNSSILTWNGDEFEAIYLELKKNFEGITKFIVRFDYWLEMMVINPFYVQDAYGSQIVDYVSDCQEKLPENARIVCFPRYPKPHESNAPWIKDHWIEEDGTKENSNTQSKE